MKEEKEIRERLERLESRMENEVAGSPEWTHLVAEKQSLEWVLRE